MTKNCQRGFSLFEVLIAISVFAIFFIVFANSFFQNQRASSELNEELVMSTLAEKIIRETMTNPPSLNESLHNSNKKENFEDPYRDYSYTIEWAKLELPNFADLMKLGNEEQNPSGQQSIINQVFKKVQDATKDILWQLRLTVIHNTSGRQYPISLWLKNPDKEITLSGVGRRNNPQANQAQAP